MKISSFLLIILILGMGMISCISSNKKKVIENPIANTGITDTFYIVNTMTSERIRIES